MPIGQIDGADVDAELAAAVFAYGSLDEFRMWGASDEDVARWWRTGIEPILVGWLTAWRSDLTPGVWTAMTGHTALTLPEWAATSIPTEHLPEWMNQFENPVDAARWHTSGYDPCAAGALTRNGWVSPEELQWWQHVTGLTDPSAEQQAVWGTSRWTDLPVHEPGDGELRWTAKDVRRGGLFDLDHAAEWAQTLRRCWYGRQLRWWVTPATAAACLRHGLTAHDVVELCERIEFCVDLPVSSLIPKEVLLPFAAGQITEPGLVTLTDLVADLPAWWDAGVFDPDVILTVEQHTHPVVWAAWQQHRRRAVTVADVTRWDIPVGRSGTRPSPGAGRLPVQWLVRVAALMQDRGCDPDVFPTVVTSLETVCR